MDVVVKYFYEEPAALEVLSAPADPDARRRAGAGRAGATPEAFLAHLSAARAHFYRGYLAATDLGAARTGLTVLPAEAYLALLLTPTPPGATGSEGWYGAHRGAPAPRLVDPVACLTAPRPGQVVARAEGPPTAGDMEALVEHDRRQALDSLRALLGASAVVYLAEPAPEGYDWSLYATQPLRRRVEAAMQAGAAPGVRYFSIPFVAARSEAKFYFERYDLERFAAYQVGGQGVRQK